MRRPQFTLRALLVLTFGCACFFGGMAAQRFLDRPVSRQTIGLPGNSGYIDIVFLRDGSHRSRWVPADAAIPQPIVAD